MKILIDIGHPAHVHYFKNLIFKKQKEGWSFRIVARDKDVAHALLNAYKIPFVSKGKGGKNFFGKLKFFFKSNHIIYQQAREFQPDLVVSCASPYIWWTYLFLGVPHYTIDDTEISKIGRIVYAPTAKKIINPSCYQLNFSPKQVFFNSYFELFYLHPNFFKPQLDFRKKINACFPDGYAVVRFVNKEAVHDRGRSALTKELQNYIVNEVKKIIPIIVSSEDRNYVNATNDFQFKPEEIHEVLAGAKLLIGESATMASEAAVLGVPSIYFDDIGRGYTDEQREKYQLIYQFGLTRKDVQEALISIPSMISEVNQKQVKLNHHKLLSDKINPTKFLVELIQEGEKEIRNSKSPQVVKGLRAKVVIASYVLLLLATCFLPLVGLENIHKQYYSGYRLDHLLHALLFIPLPVIVHFFFIQFNFRLHFLLLFFLSICIAFIAEFIHYIIPYRAFSWMDMTYNVIGVFFGMVTYLLLSFYFNRVGKSSVK